MKDLKEKEITDDQIAEITGGTGAEILDLARALGMEVKTHFDTVDELASYVTTVTVAAAKRTGLRTIKVNTGNTVANRYFDADGNEYTHAQVIAMITG